jgi:hypothetical protein
MKRPIPVILTAILLGCFAVLELFGGCGISLLALFAFKKGIPTSPTAPPSPFPASMFPIMFLLMAIFCLALAAWFVATLIGLVRLKSWARYSVLVIAGCMATFGGFGAISSLLIPVPLTSANPGLTAPDPRIIHGVFMMMAIVYAIVTAIGIALLVYYNLAGTRAAFLQPPAAIYVPPKTSTGRPRPTAITVLSWLLFLGALEIAIFAFLPFPAFIFGFILDGWRGHLSYAAVAVLSFIGGYGLFRLYNWGRLIVVGWFGVGLVHFAVVLTPWGASRMRIAMNQISARLPGYTPEMAHHNMATSSGFLIFIAIFSIAFYVVLFWLLHRHRVAFTPLPSPPPIPLEG